MVYVVVHLPSKYKALSSNPSVMKRRDSEVRSLSVTPALLERGALSFPYINISPYVYPFILK
jgi:hypothetical protein